MAIRKQRILTGKIPHTEQSACTVKFTTLYCYNIQFLQDGDDNYRRQNGMSSLI